MNENELYPLADNPAHNEVQPGIAISPEVNPDPVPPKRGIKTVIIAVGAIIIVFGGLIGLGYSKGYSVKGLSILTPAKIWDKFYSGNTTKIATTAFTADYSDPEPLDDPSSEMGISLKNIKVHLGGSTYANLSDAAKPEVDGTMKFTLGSGNTSFSSGLEYRILNNNAFYKVGDIPFLSGIGGPNNAKVDWIKINLDQAKSQSNESGEFLQSLTDPAFQEKIRKIWVDNKAIKLSKYMGRGKINGASTLHFQAELDKDSAKKAIMETIMTLAALDETAAFSEEDKSLLNASIEKLVSKIEIKELDAWIGIRDQNLYKIHLVSNAPSIVSLIKQIGIEQRAGGESMSPGGKQKEMEDFLNKLSFGATFNFDATYSDYGKTKALLEPANAFDLLNDMGDY